MKKIFTLAAALMMLSASAETLSLYSYETESYFVPINSMWLDTPGNKTQVLYPAADLTNMVGQEITAITFYTDADGNKMNDGVLELYMGETDANVLEDYVEGLTLVGTATMTASADTVLTLTFDTPYLYQGGNLIFGNVVKTKGNMTMTYFGGQEPAYNNCVYYGAGGKQFKKFLPVTTFTYGSDTPQPQVIRGDVNNDTQVNVTDVIVLLNAISSNDFSAVDELNADVDGNDAVNVTDVIKIINYVSTNSWGD